MVSTKKQVNKSQNHENDIPLQREACHEYAKYRPDWKIIKEFEEKGVSGFKVSAKDRDAIMLQIFANMKGVPEEEKFKEIMQKKKRAYRATAKKASYNIEKNKRQLKMFQLEIGKTLLGDSIYTPVDLQDAIKVVKNRIAEDEEKLAKMDEQFSHQEEMIKSIMPAYK